MADELNRFLLPLVFTIVGFMAVVGLIIRIPDLSGTPLATYDLVSPFPGGLSSDLFSILLLAIPLYFFEFFILAVPVAALMLLVNRLYRVKSYTQSVMSVGRRFGASRIIRRAIVPALFALSFSGIAQQLFPNLLVGRVDYASGIANVPILTAMEPLIWLIGALVAMFAAILIFAPTWLLNDSGIVSHLKEEELQMRRCPDTEGVGKWYSHYVSGFALLSYPVTTAHKFIIAIPTLIIERGGTIGPVYISESLVWIVGLPLVAMAFIIPLIILNELLLSRTSGVVRGAALRLGAIDTTYEAIEPGPVEEESGTSQWT